METPPAISTNLAGDNQMHSKQQISSPRNTSSSTMPTGGTYVQIGPIDVSKSLQDGDKFVKWDEVSFIYC